MNTLQLATLRDNRRLLLLMLTLLPLHIDAQPTDTSFGNLVITFTDIRNETGSIRMGLYDNTEQWTDTPKYTYSWEKIGIVNKILKVEIDSLPRGRYACAVLDDEDNSITMNYKLGLPVEGWGMSANPSFLKLKKPAFNEVAFDLDGSMLRLEIKINYLNKRKQSAILQTDPEIGN